MHQSLSLSRTRCALVNPRPQQINISLWIYTEKVWRSYGYEQYFLSLGYKFTQFSLRESGEKLQHDSLQNKTKLSGLRYHFLSFTPCSLYMSVFHYSWMTGLPGKALPHFSLPPSASHPLFSTMWSKTEPDPASGPSLVFPCRLFPSQQSQCELAGKSGSDCSRKSRLSFHREGAWDDMTQHLVFFCSQIRRWTIEAVNWRRLNRSCQPRRRCAQFSADEGQERVQKWSNNRKAEHPPPPKSLFTPRLSAAWPRVSVWIHQWRY